MEPEALLAHRNFIRDLARRLVRDSAVAEDVEQDTWRYLIAHPPAIASSMRGWLATAVRNFARQHYRADRRRVAREVAAPTPSPVEAAADFLAREALRRRVVDAVLALEEPNRTAVLLRHLDELPIREVARRLGVPPETARTRVRRGLQRLRLSLERDIGEGRVFQNALAPLIGGPGSWLGEGLIMTGKIWCCGAVTLALVCGWLTWREAPATIRMTATGAPSVALPIEDAAADARPMPPAAHGEIAADPGRIEAAPAQLRLDPPWGEIEADEIRGVVLGPDGAPAAGAEVLAHPTDLAIDASGERAAGDPRIRATIADGAGWFSLSDLPRAAWFRLAIRAAGFSPVSVGPLAAGSHQVVVLDPAVRVVGRVMALDGAPIAGAKLRALTSLDGSSLLREAESAADGSYVLPDLPSLRVRRRTAGADSLWITATALGFAAQVISVPTETWPPGGGQHEFQQPVVLVRGSRLTGRVLDAQTGAPIDAARVWVCSHEIPATIRTSTSASVRLVSANRIVGEATTDAGGTFEIDHLPARGFHPGLPAGSGPGGRSLGVVVAWKDGFELAQAQARELEDGATTRVELSLHPVAFVTGRVVDGFGAAVPGAAVSAIGEVDAAWVPDALMGIVPPDRGLTGADGAYRLAVPVAREPSAVRVVASAAGGLRQGGVAGRAAAGEVIALPDLSLLAQPRVEVLVIDEAGAPLFGAHVTLGAMVKGPAWQTDERGIASLALGVGRPTNGGDATWVASMPGRVPARAGLSASGDGGSNDAAGASRCTITLRRGAVLEGRVVYADQQPAIGAIVEVRAMAAPAEPHPVADRRDWLGRTARVETDRDGMFRVDTVADGAYRVRAIHVVRGEELRVEQPDVAIGSEGVVLVLPDPQDRTVLNVSGRVRDAADGLAVARFEGVLERADRSVSVRPAEPGVFRVEVDEPGIWTLRVWGRDHAPWQGEVTLSADESEVEVRLERGVAVRGRVLPPPDPPGCYQLELEREDDASRIAARVADDGSFEAGGLRPGRYLPRVIGPTMFRIPAACADPTSSFVIPEGADQVAHDIRVITAPGGLSLGIPASTGAPRCLGQVRVRTLDGTRLADGEIYTGDAFHVALPPGEVVIRFEPIGRQPVEVVRLVHPGGFDTLPFPDN